MYHDPPKLPPWRYELSRLAGPLADVSRAQGLLLGWLGDVLIALCDEASVGDRDDAAPLHPNVRETSSFAARRDSAPCEARPLPACPLSMLSVG
jgi:hypothetical protein